VYGGNEAETATMLDRMTGGYAVAYWALIAATC